MKRYWSGLLLAPCVFGTPSVARAEPYERLVYRAADGCPTQDEFVAAVRARGGNVDLDISADAGEIDVAIERNGAGYRGTARVLSGARSSVAREVSSPRCSEVADGLAIVTALASQGADIDEPPRATDDGSAHDPLTAGRAAPPPAAPPPAAPPPAAPPPAAAPKPAPERSRLHTLGQFRETTLPVHGGQITVKNDLVVTLSAGALFGIVPSTVVPRFDLTLARTNFITTPDGEGHIIGGILRVRWTMLGPSDYRSSDGSTRILGFKAGVGGCSQLFYDLDGFVLLTCGEIAAGVANLNTRDPAGRVTQERTVGLGTASFELDARYNVSRLFHVGLVAGGEAWATKIQANRPDGSEIFHTNPFGGYATAGIGLHFW